MDEIRDSIKQSLSDTFQIMFNLDIFLLPQLPPGEGDAVTAYVDMAWKEAKPEAATTKAHLTVAVAREIVQLICDRTEPAVPVHSAIMIQDVVCEITNIGANHLRSHLCDKMDLEVVLGLPVAGLPTRAPDHGEGVTLYFRVKDSSDLKVDLSYISTGASGP